MVTSDARRTADKMMAMGGREGRRLMRMRGG